MEHENALKVLEVKLEDCKKDLKQTQAEKEKHQNIVSHARKREGDLEGVIFNLERTIKFLEKEDKNE